MRDRLSLLQRDITERKADALASSLAEDFVGSGGMDRRGARQLATAMFMRYRQTGVRFGPAQVQMMGDDHASVRFTAAATGGSGGLLPQAGQLYDVATGWRLDDGDWRMTSAEWTARL